MSISRVSWRSTVGRLMCGACVSRSLIQPAQRATSNSRLAARIRPTAMSAGLEGRMVRPIDRLPWKDARGGMDPPPPRRYRPSLGGGAMCRRRTRAGDGGSAGSPPSRGPRWRAVRHRTYGYEPPCGGEQGHLLTSIIAGCARGRRQPCVSPWPGRVTEDMVTGITLAQVADRLGGGGPRGGEDPGSLPGG